MKVLITGAFGNVGTSTLNELLRQGHQVRCFDLKTRTNQKIAEKYKDQIEVVWGDLRRPEDIAGAVQGCDVVIHLAFIIPKLSATGIDSEEQPQLAREVNVGGTQNLINALRALPNPPKIIFSSSLHVFGRTQNRAPCRTVSDPVEATDHYSAHKIECERMIQASGLQWCILRFGAVFPLSLRLDPGMFDVPLDNRMEFVHTRDVGLAIANAVSHPDVWGKILLIGGGPRCQFYYRDMVARVLGAMGVGMLPEEAFGTDPFCTDWLDTTESQKLLNYQRHDFDDYIRDILSLLGYKRYLIRAFRPFVRMKLLWQSPYYRKAIRDAVATLISAFRHVWVAGATRVKA